MQILETLPDKLHTYIRLADAYNRMGKAMHSEWEDYKICFERDGEWLKTNLSPYIMQNDLSELTELKPIDLKSARKLKFVGATEEEKEEYYRVWDVLKKYLLAGKVQYICRLQQGEYYETSRAIWNQQVSIIESTVSDKNKAGNPIVLTMLVDPESLDAVLSPIEARRNEVEKKRRKQRVVQENKHKLGRKSDYDIPAIMKIAIPIYQKEARLIGERACGRKVEARLEKMGYTHKQIPDIDYLT